MPCHAMPCSPPERRRTAQQAVTYDGMLGMPSCAMLHARTRVEMASCSEVGLSPCRHGWGMHMSGEQLSACVPAAASSVWVG